MSNLLAFIGATVILLLIPGPAVVLNLNRTLADGRAHGLATVAGLEIGDSIHISHVTLPAGARSAITDRDFTIATLVAPSGLKSSEGDTPKADAE